MGHKIPVDIQKGAVFYRRVKNWKNSNDEFEVYKIASNMAEKLHHRGPDDYGIWQDDNCQLALSHRRLSILDLSSAGKQPFISNSGRFVIVFNGEIYNHLLLP